MKLKLAALGTLLLAFAINPAQAAGWTGANRIIVNYYIGEYAEGESFVLQTSDGGRYYFNLTGTEQSRQMAAALMSAMYKAKKVDLYVTDHTMAGNSWKLISHVGVAN
jgi:hypothetical protein